MTSSRSASNALVLRDLSVSYGSVTAVAGVDANVPAGVVVGIIGPNGSGKSTLLKAIAGVLPLASGDVLLGGQPIRARAARIAYVPQREEVNWDFPVSAHDVVLMGRYRSIGWLKWPGSDDRSRANSALERLGLGGMGHRHISQFSGGQQQRVFLARAMVQDPDLVLLDEPFTGIDVTNREVFHSAIREFANAGVTVLVATHDLDEVRATTDYVLCLNREMTAFGPTAETFNPDTLRRTFGGQIAVFGAAG
ncbi:MAG: metal ABC transporter ATP-binding protein [Dehalococcoidia bacterium]